MFPKNYSKSSISFYDDNNQEVESQPKERKPKGGKQCGRKQFGQLFKSVDRYGQQIKFTYHGKDTFKTTPGAIATLFVFAVLLAYAIYKCYILLNRINPEINKKSLIRDLNMAGPYVPTDFGFDLAFGVGQPIDPTIGFYTAQYVQFVYVENPAGSGILKKKKIKTTMNIDYCNNGYFNY